MRKVWDLIREQNKCREDVAKRMLGPFDSDFTKHVFIFNLKLVSSEGVQYTKMLLNSFSLAGERYL